MTETQGELWYEAMIRELTAAQDISKASHLALATAWRAASANLLLIAEAHETLARSIPDAAQAAADLGAAAGLHNRSQIETYAKGALDLGDETARLQREDREALAQLRATVADLAAEVEEQRAYRKRAEETRAEMLRLLQQQNGGHE